MTAHQTLDFDACYRAASARDLRFDGRFYTAVTSTGIYCRPICPARTPARRNVRFYRHAASAEAAGFRPCRRCRPELSPGDPGWDAPADLVARALRLIEDGVADEYGVAGLADRLHVTERHLLRLFTARLGAGPLAVARTRRLLLAKQLLTETALPVTDVAFAAGFGSVRQFNATMKAAYGFAPSELRTSSRPAAASGREGPATLTLRLGHRTPYDAGALLGFLAARAIPGVERVGPDGYHRAVPGGTITVLPGDGHMRLSVTPADTRHLARIVARCRRLLDLDADPAAIDDALGATALRPLVARRPGLRVPGAFDGFELAVRAVVGQQVSVAGARTLLGRIAARAGTPSHSGGGAGDGEPFLLFPTAEHLATSDLSGLGLTGRRMATLRLLAEQVASGALHLDAGADPAEAAERLLAIPGIGPWTAGYIVMRALRDPDAWPAGDLGLRRAMSALGIPDDDVERWRPWRAYAAVHLWSTPAPETSGTSPSARSPQNTHGSKNARSPRSRGDSPGRRSSRSSRSSAATTKEIA
ncbi:DNA-3-methyladenine glycosylase [Sphaerisporangium melleum]|uniref:DNA-3-methyladenine glycosylase II n=1 Tax=Sphaerisporangium melleum TaxID=321316 RepID=A0A917QS03_9ACTN|nr:AlkA N-terminal domain-containing protein [Sphaerisporangium melleum]GGK65712.1 DNA-3-methyladenine glycosylase [Sphaerisporangium melleum]GII69926.1 DNA-3-methyladenine glycosylase [Sphaerisporangium melleum]